MARKNAFGKLSKKLIIISAVTVCTIIVILYFFVFKKKKNNSPSTVPDYPSSTVPGYSLNTVPEYPPSTVPSYSLSTAPSYSLSTVPSYSLSTVPSYSPSTVPSYSPTAYSFDGNGNLLYKGVVVGNELYMNGTITNTDAFGVLFNVSSNGTMKGSFERDNNTINCNDRVNGYNIKMNIILENTLPVIQSITPFTMPSSTVTSKSSPTTKSTDGYSLTWPGGNLQYKGSDVFIVSKKIPTNMNIAVFGTDKYGLPLYNSLVSGINLSLIHI